MSEKLSEEGWIEKGNTFLKSRRYEEALDSFQSAIDINSENAVAWFKKGIVLHKMFNYSEALKCYDKAIALNPSYEEAEDQKIELILDMGPNEDVEEDFLEPPTSELPPEYWERYDKKKKLIEIGSTKIIRAMGVIFFVFAFLSFIIFTVSLRFNHIDIGSMISAFIFILSGVAWFAIARKFDIIAAYMKKHVPDKEKYEEKEKS